MDAALMLARVFGPTLGIYGLWLLLYGDNVSKIRTSMKNSPASLYICSVLYIFIGLFVINLYNVWSMNILLFVTLGGWVMFIRGILGLFLPQIILKGLYDDKIVGVKVIGIIQLVWGLILIWAGFYI